MEHYSVLKYLELEEMKCCSITLKSHIRITLFQVNDTHIHAPLKAEYRKLETALMLEQLKVDKNKILTSKNKKNPDDDVELKSCELTVKE